MDIELTGTIVRVGRTTYMFEDDSDAEAFAACVEAGGDIAECAEAHRCVDKVNFPSPKP